MTERTTTRFGGMRRTAARIMLPALASSAAFAGAATLSGTASAATATQTVIFAATDDVYSSSARPNVNTGAVEKLVSGKYKSDAMVTYLKFKVGTLPAGSTVHSAEVVVHKSSRLPKSAQLAQVRDTGWSEKTLTHDNRPAVGTVLSTVSPAATDMKLTFPVTKAVKSAGTYAFAVTSPKSEDVARLRSKEYGSDAPQLRITVTKPAATTPTTQPTSPAAAAPSPAASSKCKVNAKLVPSCNILWGAAAGGLSDTPRDQALREWEKKTGRVASVWHFYHRGDEMFPTKSEIAMANEPGKPRVLFSNWKVAYGTTWAKVAAGKQDARIDKLAAYIKANYKDKFFMAIHHEPENDVVAKTGSGMTAKDYAAMFRHTVKRFKAKGVTNVVFVVSYMGLEKFYNQSWWQDLYPGDDVVDWIGLDAYVSAEPGGYHYGTLTDLVNRTTDKKKFPGFYNWHQAKHANKPLMLSEWGVREYAKDPSQKAKILSTVLTELKKFPAIKGMFWFDTAKDQKGSDIRIDSSKASLTEFRKIAADQRFVVQVR